MLLSHLTSLPIFLFSTMKYCLENGNGVNSIRKNKFKSCKKIPRGDEAWVERKLIDIGFGKNSSKIHLIFKFVGGMKI